MSLPNSSPEKLEEVVVLPLALECLDEEPLPSATSEQRDKQTKVLPFTLQGLDVENTNGHVLYTLPTPLPSTSSGMYITNSGRPLQEEDEYQKLSKDEKKSVRLGFEAVHAMQSGNFKPVPVSSSSSSNIFNIVADWPKEKVTYYDFNPWLQNTAVCEADCAALAKPFSHSGISHIAYIGSRGFLMTRLTQLLRAKTVAIRKIGEMPPPVVQETYSGEYRKNTTIVMSANVIPKGARVLIVDDVFATGGTALAAVKLVEKVGAHVVGLAFLLGLPHLSGEKLLHEYNDKLIIACAYLTREDGSFFSNKLDDGLAIPGQHSVLDEPLHAGDDRAVVMWHKDAVEQARDLVQKYPRHFVGSPIETKRFPDGHYDIKFNPNLLGRHLVYVVSLLHPEETLQQLALMTALARQHVKSFTVLVTYFAPGTKERVDVPGELACAQTTAQLISEALKAKPIMGPTSVIIYDIHAVQEQFYFSDSCSLALLSSINLIGKVIKDENMILVFPDQGAYKRFGKEPLLQNVPTLVCNKERGPNDSRVIVIADRKNCGSMTDAELCKKHALVLDDIVNSGSTAVETRHVLQETGFDKISLYATHSAFPLHAWMSFLPSGSRAGFERIYTTNSVPSMTERFLKYYPETFTVLDLTKLTADFICQKYNIKPSLFVPPPKVWFGSTSKSEVEAIKRVFPDARFVPAVDPLPVISAQPYGYGQISANVSRKMDNLCKAWKEMIRRGEVSPSPTLLVSIESGLVKVDLPLVETTHYRYQTSVYVHAYDIFGNLVSFKTKENVGSIKGGPELPAWVYELVAASNFQKTVGQILVDKYPEQKLNVDDWYQAAIEGVVENHPTSRVDDIVRLLKPAQYDAIQALQHQ